QLTPFIGRDAELAELSRLLDNPACRLVSLVGPGGIGKTRLAIQSAAQHLHAFRHGVFFASLAPLSAPDFVVSTLADTLKFSFHGALEPRLQMVNFLHEKEMLLVLDNFEHVTAAAPLVADILQNAPRVKTLVTSRERLNLHGEWMLEVPGLDFPSTLKSDGVARYSALRLFVDSAQRHDASFALSDADKPHVVRICQLVEGTPLAIELAAAWVRTLSPSDIAREIERDIDFLAGTQHNLPARHRSLRAVFDHSWSLLGAPERAALMALSVFRGGFRREAAGQVAQVSTSLLASLVDRSILRRNASGRYDLHDLLRQYALKKLEENPAQEQAVKEQYGQYYAEFLHHRERFLRAGRQKDILREVAEEIENVRATWQWAVDQAKWDVIQRCTESLFFFYDLRSLFQEGAEAFGLAAQRLEIIPNLGERASDQRVLANVLARQARCLQRSGHFDAARALYRRSLDIHERLGARQDRAFVLTYLGDIYRMMGEYDEARRLLHDGIEISTESGDGYLLSRALNILGIVSSQQGDYAMAEKLYRNSLAIQRDLNDHIGMSQVLNNLGGIAFLSGDYARARYLYEESLGIQAEINDLRGAAVSLANLGDVVQELGKLEEAKRIRQESLDIRREIGDRHGVAYDLHKLGETTAALGQWPEASDYYLQALQLSMEVKVIPVVLNTLVGMAVLWSNQGKSTQALTLLEFVLNHPATEREARDRAEPLRAELASRLEPEVMAEAQALRGRTRQLEEIAEYVWAQAGARAPVKGGQ
ncbi:MAG TPA: tetratricopeptide repeat protein, partial [Anaerolineae bacterium]|nr:tetratricopeptide repeat protein [Anaerolineae bacterium]